MEDLRQQFELEMNITAAMHRDFQTLQQVRGLRQQLRTLMARMPAGPLLTALPRWITKWKNWKAREKAEGFSARRRGEVWPA